MKLPKFLYRSTTAAKMASVARKAQYFNPESGIYRINGRFTFGPKPNTCTVHKAASADCHDGMGDRIRLIVATYDDGSTLTITPATATGFPANKPFWK